MTPEARLMKAALAYARVHGLAPQDEIAEVQMHEAALAYARPIVAEECALVVESVRIHLTREQAGELNQPGICDSPRSTPLWLIQKAIDKAAAAIREHGRKP